MVIREIGIAGDGPPGEKFDINFASEPKYPPLSSGNKGRVLELSGGRQFYVTRAELRIIEAMIARPDLNQDGLAGIAQIKGRSNLANRQSSLNRRLGKLVGERIENRNFIDMLVKYDAVTRESKRRRVA